MAKYLWINAIILALSMGIFYLTVSRLDPLGEERLIAYVVFFLSIFGIVSSLITFVCFFMAEIFTGIRLGFLDFLVAVRRGFFSGLYVILLFLMGLFQVLSFIEGILLAGFFFVLEWILSTEDEEKIS